MSFKIVPTIAWGQLIKGLVHGNDLSTAMHTFTYMTSHGIPTSLQVYTLLLIACANTVSLQHGQTVHYHMIGNQVKMNAILYTSLVNMYGKCASVEEAEKLMDEVRKQAFRHNVAIWNAMMKTYAQNRLPSKAIALFQEIFRHTQPDKITFVALLTALSHGGRVEEAREYLNLMENKFKIPPTVQHYTCVIDGLARAGRLSEAEEIIISKAPEDGVAWTTLLGACRYVLNNGR